MEEPALPPSIEGEWHGEMSSALAARRQQALDLLATQRQQFDVIEADLESHLAELEQRLAAGLATADNDQHGELDQLAESLHQQADELSRQQTALAADRAEIASRQGELQLAREQIGREHQEFAETKRQELEQLEHRTAELQAAESKLKQAERALGAAQEEHQNEAQQFAARRARFDEQQSRLEKELEQVEANREETRIQRRRIAHQLKTERTALVHERELQRAELERQRQAGAKDAERAQGQIREDREAFEQEMQRARQQIRRDREQLDDESKTLAEARLQWEETRRQTGNSENDAATATLAEFNAERGELNKRIRQLEAELTDAKQRLLEQPATTDSRQAEDLQRRFEMAVDDVRTLKKEKAELEEELAELKAQGARPAVSTATAGEDWETTKRRLLAQLEGDEGQPPAARLSNDDRLTVEGAIRITDEMVQQRDREIAELKEQLAGQHETAIAEQTPAEAAEAARVFDQDDIILEERKRLLQMQQEWQDKLRQAEVEISVQRAKIARERSEVDEKLRVLEEQKSTLAAQQSSGEMPSANKPQKPARRWLTRMGLKENDKD